MGEQHVESLVADSDGALLARYLRGDMAAFAALLERYEHDALCVAGSLLRNHDSAADVVQEAFIRLAEQACSVAAQGCEHLGGWIATVVRNRALDELRRQQVRHAQELPEYLPAQETSAPQSDLDALLWQQVEALPDLERSAVYLRYREGWDYARIAQALGKTSNHVGVILNQALNRLRADGRLSAGVFG